MHKIIGSSVISKQEYFIRIKSYIIIKSENSIAESRKQPSHQSALPSEELAPYIHV